MWGAPVSGIVSIPGSRERWEEGERGRYRAPPFFVCVVPVRVAAGSPNPGKQGGLTPRSNRGHCPPRPWLTRAAEECARSWSSSAAP